MLPGAVVILVQPGSSDASLERALRASHRVAKDGGGPVPHLLRDHPSGSADRSEHERGDARAGG